MLNRIARFMKKVKARKGYTLVEAATVVAITGAMAIVSVPIASDKIEDGKIATAGGTTQAIATSMVKFFGDTANFPLGGGAASSVAAGIIDSTKKIKVLRSGVGEVNNNLDPDLDSSNVDLPNKEDLVLWAPGDTSGPKLKSDGASNNADINLNNHLVTDAVGYGNGGLNWLGPYIPSVDQDPWGRNYFAYVRAVDFDSFGEAGTGSTTANIQVPINTPASGSTTTNQRIFCWIISAGPDEKLQTAPTDSIIQNDDIGTILALPAKVKGTNDKGQGSR